LNHPPQTHPKPLTNTPHFGHNYLARKIAVNPALPNFKVSFHDVTPPQIFEG
jgi:hypothetical protein